MPWLGGNWAVVQEAKDAIDFAVGDVKGRRAIRSDGDQSCHDFAKCPIAADMEFPLRDG